MVITLSSQKGDSIGDAVRRTWTDAGLPPELFTFDLRAEDFINLCALGRSGRIDKEALAVMAKRAAGGQ